MGLLAPRSAHLGRRRRIRGVASIEAVMFLPVLILVFAGILFVIRQGRASMQARSQARSCAWRISAAGCGETPEDCVSEKSSEETSNSGKERLEKADAFQGIQGSSFAAKEIENRLDGLLVERTTSVVKVTYKQPGILVQDDEGESASESSPSGAKKRKPDQELTTSAEYRLPCNSLPSEHKNIVEALFAEFGP